jgi:hypothetical protein
MTIAMGFAVTNPKLQRQTAPVSGSSAPIGAILLAGEIARAQGYHRVSLLR